MTGSTRLLLGAIAVLTVAGAAYLLPLGAGLVALVDWMHEAGPAGMAAYALVYVLATVLMLPGSILTLGAGFSYGPLLGTALVSPISVLSATVAFVLSRTVARRWIARRISANPRFAAIDEAVAQGAFRMVLLLRLSPVMPFSLLNYALGLTRISLKQYVLASFLGMLPGTFLYVYLGSLVTNTTELLAAGRSPRTPWAQAFYWGGLLATLAVTALVTRLARRALREHIPSASPQQPIGTGEAGPFERAS